MAEKYKPNGKAGECQCVRSHETLIDGEIGQCRAAEHINGLCKGCWELHGAALEAGKVERQAH